MVKRFLLAAIFSIVGSVAAFSQTDLYKSGFDGRWEGTLKYVSPESYDKTHGNVPSNTEFAFTVNGKSAKVFYRLDTGEWHEAKPGTFSFVAYKTNAIILSMNSDGIGGNPGSWVETWNFTITHKDNDSLYVIFSRAVNNFREEPNFDDGKSRGRWFAIAFGEFARAASQ
jgi:hypothetical protein